MAFVPAPNVLQVEMRGTYFGNEFENVIYIGRDTAWDQVSWENTVPSILELIDGLTAVQSNQLVWDELYGTVLTTQNSQTFTYPISPTRPGLLTAPGLPASIALCVSFRTAARGRSFRGRNYVAGLTEADVSGNTVDADVVGTIQNAYNNFRLEFGSTTRWVVLSRRSNGNDRTVGVATPITAVVVTDNRVDSQRRRLS